MAVALTFIVLLVRLPVVRFTIPKATPITDASIMAIMIPKGLATAVLATIPLQRGVEGGEVIQNVVYVVVLYCQCCFNCIACSDYRENKIIKILPIYIPRLWGYDKLEYLILPTFYKRPDAFAEIMSSAIALNGSFFNAQRMVSQYVKNAY